jgi:hypothetical protein
MCLVKSPSVRPTPAPPQAVKPKPKAPEEAVFDPTDEAMRAKRLGLRATTNPTVATSPLGVTGPAVLAKTMLGQIGQRKQLG